MKTLLTICFILILSVAGISQVYLHTVKVIITDEGVEEEAELFQYIEVTKNRITLNYGGDDPYTLVLTGSPATRIEESHEVIGSFALDETAKEVFVMTGVAKNPEEDYHYFVIHEDDLNHIFFYCDKIK